MTQRAKPASALGLLACVALAASGATVFFSTAGTLGGDVAAGEHNLVVVQTKARIEREALECEFAI